MFRYNTAPDYDADRRRLTAERKRGYDEGFERGLHDQYLPRRDMLGRTWLNPDPIQRVVQVYAPSGLEGMLPHFGLHRATQHREIALFEAQAMYIDGPCPVAYWAWHPVERFSSG